jgi:hypothetical protein
VPSDRIEIAFVLREIFGIRDDLIGEFFRIHCPSEILLGRGRADSGDIFQILHALSELRVVGGSIHEKLLLLDSSLALRERAAACEPGERIRNGKIWDAALELAWEGDFRGQSLVEFADGLLEKFFEVCDPEPIDPDRIQIDTYHGAKGLEWPVVLLPFFRRNMTLSPERLPKFAFHGDGPRFFTCKTPDYGEFKGQQMEGKLRTLERLLYVAMTRVKETLILAHGETEAEGRSPQALLGLDVSLLPAFQPLGVPVPLAREPVRIFANEERRDMPWEPPRGDEAAMSHILSPIDLEKSLLVRPSPAPDPVVDGEAVAYGNWWHRTMQYFPWGESDQHTDYLRRAAGEAPQRERAERETALFLRSSCYGAHAGGGWKFLSEWPFFDGRNGAIDLICLGDGRVEIIDWKTELGESPDGHLEQLTRYLRVVERHLGGPVEVYVYFTATGECRFSLASSR